MKRTGNIYDFSDFASAVQATGAKVIQPAYADFAKFEGHQSQAKLKREGRPMLSDIRVAEFLWGSRPVFFKKRYTDHEYKEFDYLKVKYDLVRPPPNMAPRGVTDAKKADIVHNLTPFMPVHADLIDNMD